MITAVPVIEVHCFVISESDQVGVQSLEMLKVRVVVEERLKQEGILCSRAPKANAQKRLKPDVGPTRFGNGHASSLSTSKLPQIVSAKPNKPKVVSGDDDLPKRDDVGERQRKHEL